MFGGRSRPSFALAAVLLLALFASANASAQPVVSAPAAASPLPAASASASAPPVASVAAPPPAPTDPRVEQILALVRGDLDVAIEPSALFDVPLDDHAAIELERVRLNTLLLAIEEASAPVLGLEEKAKPAAPSKPAASAAPQQPPTPKQAMREEIAALDTDRWQGRLALDRARLTFYELPPSDRADLLDAHEERRAAARPQESDAELRAREAEAERQKALQAAAAARSEAERLVAEELARVIGVESAITKVRNELATDRKALAARRDEVLGWQRRVRDAKAAGPAEADATYVALRAALRASRDALATILDESTDDGSAVPTVGPDPTLGLGSDVSTDELRARRAEVGELSQRVQSEEIELRALRAASLHEEITTLNRERLGLLPQLSPGARAAVTGFTEAGVDQAHSESRQLVLLLRYHRRLASSWVRTLLESRSAEGVSAWTVAAVLVPWMLLVAVFVWFRRRSPGLLAAIQQRLTEQDRSDRRSIPSPQSRVVRLVRGIHRPLEWLAFFGLSVSLLPTSARGLLEIEILIVIVGWTLGGALVVNGINSIAASTETAATSTSEDVAKLRLRSLQLVGRVVVLFALILVLSARLVGRGTLYSWVISTCWFAVLPVFLVLVRWWREIVFVRVERVRRKSSYQAWVLANRRGWTSFIAAMSAAVHLFTVGAFRTVRNWLTGFDLARRGHAYLFKRGLERLVEVDHGAKALPLPPAEREILAPDRTAKTWVGCPADDVVEALEARLTKEAYGVVAVIGAIGMGKTTLLRRLEAMVPRARLGLCHSSTTTGDLAALREGGPTNRAEPVPTAPRLVLLDDAHALVRPVAGGLRPFDAALALARDDGRGALWVFALDSVVWPFLQRARDARPLFDEVFHLEPWADENIGELLTARCADGGMIPTFEDLLEKLPPEADEIDKQEALAAKRTGYFRMVWDYSRGNPAIALEAWRASLVVEPERVAVASTTVPEEAAEPEARTAGVEIEDGAAARSATAPRTVRVRPLMAPPASRLEILPDSALFILRAVLQLSRATVPEIASATRIAEAQVQNAVSFGVSQGYYAVDGAVVHVTWPWLRSVMLWLERRHLLVNP